jgi:hypothetical protein
MADQHTIERYQRWYRKLLSLYSKPHRERFAESMEQPFHDLCRDGETAANACESPRSFPR